MPKRKTKNPADNADNKVTEVIQDVQKTDVKEAADAGLGNTATVQSEGEILPVPSDAIHQEAKVNRAGASLAPFVSGAPPRPSDSNPAVLVRPQETENTNNPERVLKFRKLRVQEGLPAKVQPEDLSGMDFSGMDLSDQDFSGDDLRGAKFVNAKIAGAKFDGANLQGADLTGSDYEDADLSGADVRWIVK